MQRVMGPPKVMKLWEKDRQSMSGWCGVGKVCRAGLQCHSGAMQNAPWDTRRGGGMCMAILGANAFETELSCMEPVM